MAKRIAILDANAHRAALKNPPKSPEAYLTTLEKQGLTRVVSLVRPYQGLI